MPPEMMRKPSAASVSARTLALATTCRAYSRNSGCMASRKLTALAAMMCTSGPPCIPGNTTLSMAAANSCLLRIMPARGPRRVLCVVVVTIWACGTGRRMRASGNQPGEMGHVHQVERAHLVRDLAHAGEINDSRIGAASADDQLGTFLLGKLLQIVVIDGFRFLGHAVRNDAIRLAGKFR